MAHKTNAPIFVTRNGYGDMVILSMEAYEEIMARNEIVSAIMTAEEQVASGAKPVPAKEAFASLRAKYAGQKV
jgi:PHD/YefM family antitoxin component YafN of YafNO toxin-antitoxin module